MIVLMNDMITAMNSPEKFFMVEAIFLKLLFKFKVNVNSIGVCWG